MFVIGCHHGLEQGGAGCVGKSDGGVHMESAEDGLAVNGYTQGFFNGRGSFLDLKQDVPGIDKVSFRFLTG